MWLKIFNVGEADDPNIKHRADITQGCYSDIYLNYIGRILYILLYHGSWGIYALIHFVHNLAMRRQSKYMFKISRAFSVPSDARHGLSPETGRSCGKNRNQKRMASQHPKFPDELVHAAIADIMLKTAQQLSSFLELYFETAHPSIIKISLELVKTIKLDCVSDRVKLLESLLSQNRITVSEFPIFCHLCYCQLKFNGLSETKTAKMIALQNSVYQKLQAENVSNLTRFHHLTLLSQQFVNIFHANP